MKKYRISYRCLSIFLMVLFVITSLSIPVMAAEAQAAEFETVSDMPDVSADSGFEADFDEQSDEPYPVTEDVTRREANVKHFDLGYGNYEAIVYSDAVHRKDANGQWQDIDNRLAASGTARYATSDGRTAVATRAGTAEPLITVGENGYRIEMTPVPRVTGNTANSDSTVTPVAQIQNHADPSVRVSDDPYALADTTTRVTYEDVYPNVDLEYVLTGNDVKENIIVSAPMSSYSYTFLLEIDGLYAVLEQSGDIVLYDADSDEAQYVMPAPYMYDANGVTSYDVSYILTESDKEGVYAVTVAADADWFANTSRAFPVVIDPTIQTACYADTYIDSSYPTTNYANASRLWVSPGAIPFFRMTPPTLAEGSQFISATLYVYCYYVSYVTSNELTIGAYQVTSPWSTTGITWNSACQYDNFGISTTQLSSCVLAGNVGAYEGTPKSCSFNVTSAFQSWYSGSPNYGIALRYEGGTNTSACVRSRESGTSYGAYYKVLYAQPVVATGVYRLLNNANQNLCLDVKDGGYTEGTPMQLWSVYTSLNRNQLFRITYAGTIAGNNFYTIRSMTNSALGLYHDDASSDTITLKQLPAMTAQQMLQLGYYNYLWILTEESGKYTIKNGVTIPGNYMTVSSNPSNGSVVYGGASDSTNGRWILSPYTGSALEGIDWRTQTTTLTVGDIFTYRATMYSSEKDLYGAVRYSVTNTNMTETDKATINATTGRLVTLKTGQVTICVTCSGTTKKYYKTVTITSASGENLYSPEDWSVSPGVDDTNAVCLS